MKVGNVLVSKLMPSPRLEIVQHNNFTFTNVPSCLFVAPGVVKVVLPVSSFDCVDTSTEVSTSYSGLIPPPPPPPPQEVSRSIFVCSVLLQCLVYIRMSMQKASCTT